MHYGYIRSFLAEHNLSLDIEPIKEVLPPRENDQSIMDLVSESNFKDYEIKRIYYCKFYLQVWWVSDLCNATGTRVKRELYKGEGYEPTRSFSTNEEFNQEKPDENSWRIWKKFLNTTICDEDRYLYLSLEQWTLQESTRKWPYYFSPSKDRVYRCYREKWYDHTKYCYDYH